MDIMSATRLWGTLAEALQLYKAVDARIVELQREHEAEKREPGEQVPVKYRGKAQSPAEELITAVLDLWTSTLEQCRREADDEGDLEPPEAGELAAFMQACLAEFYVGSLTLRLAIVRTWKRIFVHFKEERMPVCDGLGASLHSQLTAAIQDASLDQRSERLRRPALELSKALLDDPAPGGGREALLCGLKSADDASQTSKVMPLAEWLGKLDPTTIELCADAVAVLRGAQTGKQ